MPLLSTIIWVLLNLCIALGINYVIKELGIINHSEFISLYFIIAAARFYDSQLKFTIAYKTDPDLVEQIMRNELNKQ